VGTPTLVLNPMAGGLSSGAAGAPPGLAAFRSASRASVRNVLAGTTGGNGGATAPRAAEERANPLIRFAHVAPDAAETPVGGARTTNPFDRPSVAAPVRQAFLPVSVAHRGAHAASSTTASAATAAAAAAAAQAGPPAGVEEDHVSGGGDVENDDDAWGSESSGDGDGWGNDEDEDEDEEGAGDVPASEAGSEPARGEEEEEEEEEEGAIDHEEAARDGSDGDDDDGW
jgi:hypothetical protein